MVIEGIDVGIMGMRRGGKRRFVIPPIMAYGSVGIPEKEVPAGALLHYEVLLEGIFPTTISSASTSSVNSPVNRGVSSPHSQQQHRHTPLSIQVPPPGGMSGSMWGNSSKSFSTELCPGESPGEWVFRREGGTYFA